MNNVSRIAVITTFIFLFGLSGAYAQGSLGKGNKQLNAGVGLSNWGVPIYAGLDFGVHPDITVGPIVSFRNWNQRIGTVNYSHNIFVLGVNGNYHFNTLIDLDPEWDLYAGATLGYWFWTSSSNYPGTYVSTVGFVGQIGARYFFSDKFGANLELGGGYVSGGRLGVTLKL
ncbi:MAG: hypothetical protein ACFHWX_13845 [Bacteroidota bacterium]